MTLLARIRVESDGFPGAPGYNILHFSEGQAVGGGWGPSLVDQVCTEVHTLYSDLATYLRHGTTFRVVPDVTIFDDATGEIQDVKAWETDLLPISTSGDQGPVPWSTAALVRLTGDRFVNGRRVNGRVFLGPLAGRTMDGTGRLMANFMGDIGIAFEAITGGLGPRLAVWHRPTTRAAANGTYADVAAVSVRSTPSNLRKRAF